MSDVEVVVCKGCGQLVLWAGLPFPGQRIPDPYYCPQCLENLIVEKPRRRPKKTISGE